MKNPDERLQEVFRLPKRGSIPLFINNLRIYTTYYIIYIK